MTKGNKRACEQTNAAGMMTDIQDWKKQALVLWECVLWDLLTCFYNFIATLDLNGEYE